MTVHCSRCGRFDFPAPTVCFWCRTKEERESAEPVVPKRVVEEIRAEQGRFL